MQRYQSVGKGFCNVKLLWFKTTETICTVYSAHELFSLSWKMIIINENRRVNEKKKDLGENWENNSIT